MQHGGQQRSLHARRRDGEAEHHERGRQGETDPGGQRAGQPGASQPDQESGLAARRPGQHLAQRDQPGVVLGGQPAALAHIGAFEITEMRDGAAERCQAEAERHTQHLTGAAASRG